MFYVTLALSNPELNYIFLDNNLKTNQLSGIFLEAPFNKMSDEVKEYLPNGISKTLEWIGINIDEILNQADLAFNSTFWLKSINLPIRIMHAEDDKVIPFHLAVKMYDDLRYNDLSEARANVAFHPFSTEEQLGHEGIFKAKNPKLLRDVVSKFVRIVLFE